MKHPEKYHTLVLAANFKIALEREEYEICAVIKTEIDRRIESGKIAKKDTELFRHYNPLSNEYEGDVRAAGLNGLFDRVLS